MDGMMGALLDFCNIYPHMAEPAIDLVSYAISRYGLNTDREYWRDLARNSDDPKILGMRLPYSEFFDIVEKPIAVDSVRKLRGRGLAKMFRWNVFTDPDLVCIDENLLLKLFLDELNERGRIKTSYNTMTCSDYLWYVTYEGRLGRVKWGGSKCNANKMIKKGLIAKDKYGVYRAKQVLNGCGCEAPKHRPILKSLSRGRWSEEIMNKLTELLDGGHELEYVIDRNFADAYDPGYENNVYIDDLVTSQSCMSYRGSDAQSFYGNIDGCYVMRFLKDGENIGRCIMYEYNGIRHFIRIYCRQEYQRDCLYTLRKQMRENDLFGRCERIEGIKLECHFDDTTKNMYLDGNRYGFVAEEGRLFMVDGDYEYDGESTYQGSFEYVIEDYHIHRCYSCGDWITDRDGIHDDDYDRWYCCEDCAYQDDYIQCDYCGDWCHSSVDTEDGHHFCSTSCAQEDGYVRCEDTDEWIPEDDAFYVNGWAYSSEESAREDGWDKCVECGEWTKMRYQCEGGKTRCEGCLRDEWELKYVKIKDKKDEETETSGD